MTNTSWILSWNTYPMAATAYDLSTSVVSIFKFRASLNSPMLPAQPFFPNSGWVIYLPVCPPLHTDTQHKPVHHQKPGSCGNLQSVDLSAVPDQLHYVNLLVHGLLVFIGGILLCLLLHLDCGTLLNPHIHIIRFCMHEVLGSNFPRIMSWNPSR